MTTRVGRSVIGGEQHGRVGGQQADDVFDVGDSPARDVGVGGRLHPPAVAGVIEPDEVKHQEVRRRAVSESFAEPLDARVVHQRLGAQIEDDPRHLHLGLGDDEAGGK